MATIPAIVLGHVAQHQIRRNNEAGGAIALTGVILGWTGLVLIIAFVVFDLIVGLLGGETLLKILGSMHD